MARGGSGWLGTVGLGMARDGTWSHETAVTVVYGHRGSHSRRWGISMRHATGHVQTNLKYSPKHGRQDTLTSTANTRDTGKTRCVHRGSRGPQSRAARCRSHSPRRLTRHAVNRYEHVTRKTDASWDSNTVVHYLV
eukprot:5139464-Prymnesium_polylepis.1